MSCWVASLALSQPFGVCVCEVVFSTSAYGGNPNPNVKGKSSTQKCRLERKRIYVSFRRVSLVYELVVEKKKQMKNYESW